MEEENLRESVEQLKRKLADMQIEPIVINFAINTVIINGTANIAEVDIKEYYEECLEKNKKKIEEGKFSLITPEYEVVILKCAKVLADEEPMVILAYIKDEMAIFNMPNL